MNDDETQALIDLRARLGVGASEPVPVGPEQRARLLEAVTDAGRFERFVPTVAAMADVSHDQARVWLDGVWGDLPSWEPATTMAKAWWVEGGPKTKNALRGFVHVPAGAPFPHHKHLGDELVLVLQGGARISTGERIRAGDEMVTRSGEEHAFEAVPGGPDLLVFTVVHGGLDFGRFVARARD